MGLLFGASNGNALTFGEDFFNGDEIPVDGGAVISVQWLDRGALFGFIEPTVIISGLPIDFFFSVDPWAIGLPGSIVQEYATDFPVLTLPVGPPGSADEHLPGGPPFGVGPWSSGGLAAGGVFSADPISAPGTNIIDHLVGDLVLADALPPMEDDLDALEHVGDNTAFGLPAEPGNTHDRVDPTAGFLGGVHPPDLGDPLNPNHDVNNGNPIIFSVERGSVGDFGSAVKAQVLSPVEGASGELFIAVIPPDGPFIGTPTNMLLIDEGQLGLSHQDDLDAVIVQILLPTVLDNASTSRRPPLWLVLLATSAAGAMGWGIRGQYGHETGAMVPGVLVALTLVFLFQPNATSLQAARAVALTAVAFGFGGSMTYGQTVGLTHDHDIVEKLAIRGAAFRWGMLGLFIKGGIWIGFAGAFLGIGLGGKRYRPLEMLAILAGMIVLMLIGIKLINRPFDPSERVLPTIYFSDDWHWEPEKVDMQPRPEKWGGVLLAPLGLTIYTGWKKRDSLARNMALAGFLAGGFGFTIGQSVQASWQWYPQWYKTGLAHSLTQSFNWWNMMETTFGLVLGFGLGLGLWLNRHRIAPGKTEQEAEIPVPIEWVLMLVHVAALLSCNFLSYDTFDSVADLALTMGVIPIVCVLGGRYWPYMMALPILALPIAGKTLRAMCYHGGDNAYPMLLGWIYFAIIPLGIMLCAAYCHANWRLHGQTGRSFLIQALLLSTWIYLGLNFVFFGYPWPWEPSGGRSPNAAIFNLCAVILTLTALTYNRRPAQAHSKS